MTAFEQFLHTILFVMLHRVVLAVKYVHEALYRATIQCKTVEQ